MVWIRPAVFPADAAAVAALDTSFTTERIYQLHRADWTFALVETVVAPPIVKAFPLDDAFDDDFDASAGAWSSAVVAEREGSVIGFAAVTFERWNRRANLWHLYVAPQQRGQGVGRQLIEAMQEYARGQGARCLWLETTNLNYPAIQFYHRVGFRLCGWDESLYDPAGPAAGEFALFMACDLN